MIYRILVIVIFLHYGTQANFTGECEIRAKTSANLDLAVHLLETIRDNYVASKPVCSLILHPMDCEDVLRNGQNTSGIYDVWPRSRIVNGPIKVYCDMDTDGGGWTVFQRRGNFSRPKDYFFQDWQSYKKGFGSIEKDFWLGNDNIFALSNQRLYSVRFDLRDVQGIQRYAMYDTFWIDDEDHEYTLHIKGYQGDAGDSMLTSHNHDGQNFTTKDRKNDHFVGESNCAILYKGAWWYNKCHSVNLNGLYHGGKHEGYADGVNWSTFRGPHESMEWTEIKLRSKDFLK